MQCCIKVKEDFMLVHVINKELSREIIREMRVDRVAKFCGRTKSAVQFWSCKGMPIAWAKAIKKDFPHLLAWQEYSEESKDL